jgi:hypothetical protein
MEQSKHNVRNRKTNGGAIIANWQLGKRTKLEESGYSIEPEQVMHGIIRKEMKLIECVKGRKKKGLTM